MRTILKIIHIEFYKITKKKRYSLFFGLQFLMICIILIALWGRFMNIPLLNINMLPYRVLMILYSTIIPLLILMLSNDLFSSEFQTENIAAMLSKPVLLYKIYLAKIFTIVSIVTINMMIVGAIMAINNLIDGGLYEGIQVIKSYILTLVPMSSYIMFISFMAITTDSSVMHVFTIILFYILGIILKLCMPAVSLLTFGYHNGFYNMWVGYRLPLSYRISVLLLLIAYSIIFCIMGYFKFERKRG